MLHTCDRSAGNRRSGFSLGTAACGARTAALLGMGLIALSLGGCGGARPAQVAGQVAYQGAAIEQGTIRFYPTDGTPGEGAATEIRDGAYEIAVGQGLVAGAYRVAISATRPTGRTIHREPIEPGPLEEIDEFEQYLPEQYSEQLTLTAKLEGGANEVNFDLE